MSPTPIMQDAPARRSHSDETPGSAMETDEAPLAAEGGGQNIIRQTSNNAQAQDAAVVS